MATRKQDLDANFQIMHITIKATGRGHRSDRWIFTDDNKIELMEELRRFLRLFTPCKLLAITIMSNHAHFILKIPKNYSTTRNRVATDYLQCYGKKLHPNCHMIRKLMMELNSVSCLMQRFLWHFSTTFNHNKSFKRTGHLWDSKFHNTNIGDANSLLKCWVYVIFNPAKANIVKDPSEYKFSSMTYSDRGFRQEVLQNLFEAYKELSGHVNMKLKEFKKIIKELIEQEVKNWEIKEEFARAQYREENHFWDKVTSFVDENHFVP